MKQNQEKEKKKKKTATFGHVVDDDADSFAVAFFKNVFEESRLSSAEEAREQRDGEAGVLHAASETQKTRLWPADERTGRPSAWVATTHVWERAWGPQNHKERTRKKKGVVVALNRKGGGSGR